MKKKFKKKCKQSFCKWEDNQELERAGRDWKSQDEKQIKMGYIHIQVTAINVIVNYCEHVLRGKNGKTAGENNGSGWKEEKGPSCYFSGQLRSRKVAKGRTRGVLKFSLSTCKVFGFST